MIDELEKEELFAEFALRLAERDSKEKRLSVAKNNHVLKGVTKIYYDMCRSGDATTDYLAYEYPGLYHAYIKIRSVIPNLVMLKKAHNQETFDGRIKYVTGVDPVLEDEDIEEATKVGKIMLEAAITYLTE